MMLVMIIRTQSNIVFSKIAPAQAMQYQSRPAAYIHDLKESVINEAHTRALAVKSGEEVQQGVEFVEKMAKMSSWYQPPKGQVIDEYA